MKLPPLPQNKQTRLILAISAATFAIIIAALFVVSYETKVTELPGQAPAIVEPEAPPAPPNTENSQIILELFSPSDTALNEQLSTTDINQKIEQTLTVSYVLTKCLIISQDDYTDAYHALVLYAQLTKLAPDQATADAKVREIAESANASYALIYSRTSCTDKQLQPLAGQLTSWTNDMLKRKP